MAFLSSTLLDINRLFNEDNHFDYRPIHNSHIIDPVARDLNSNIFRLSGTMMPATSLMSSLADNAKTSANIIDDQFVARAISSREGV